jgi:hypothetical protein
MDQNDYVIKQRLIQSLQFITNGFVTSAVDVTEEDVAAYYEENRDDYYVDPYATFTHVYFSSDRHGSEEARALAAAKLEELNRDGIPFSESTRHGERFLYNVNYVERTEDESAYGQHLVMLTKLTEGVYPPLEEIEAAVREDALRLAIIRANDKAVQAIVDTYDIRMEFGQ